MSDEQNVAIITPTDNGPYYIRGKFTIVLDNGETLEADGETWLCRCGGSQHKPFCDGTHHKINFQSDSAQMLAAQHEEATAEEEREEAVATLVDGYQEVGDASAVGEGELVGVKVGGQQVVVGRVGGCLYAIGGVCTHEHALLEDGDLDGEVVMCPLHNSGFNIKTGQAVQPPAEEPEPTYAVKEEDGKIYVAAQPQG